MPLDMVSKHVILSIQRPDYNGMKVRQHEEYFKIEHQVMAMHAKNTTNRQILTITANAFEFVNNRL